MKDKTSYAYDYTSSGHVTSSSPVPLKTRRVVDDLIARIFVTDERYVTGKRKELHASRLSGLSNDFWLQFQTPVASHLGIPLHNPQVCRYGSEPSGAVKYVIESKS
ncbi:hypothetical protein TNCV_3900451 [Trichonephila clavipes]|nr:hypothetical protein TNCV_3900451 [Trichonephila clavipes]